MRIERQTRRSALSLPVMACGCLAVLVGGGILAAILGVFLLPGIVLQLSGFQSRGSTEALFESITPLPTVQIVSQEPTPASAVINLGQFGSQPLNNNLYNYTLATGSTASGQRAAALTFDENGLFALCQQRSDVCGPTNPRFRNARIDLRPGGAVINGEVFVPQIGLWQSAGLVVQLTSDNRSLTVAGIDVGGSLYSTPPNEFRDLITEIERQGNAALQQLALEAGGSIYSLSGVSIDHNTLTLILQ